MQFTTGKLYAFRSHPSITSTRMSFRPIKNYEAHSELFLNLMIFKIIVNTRIYKYIVIIAS